MSGKFRDKDHSFKIGINTNEETLRGSVTSFEVILRTLKQGRKQRKQVNTANSRFSTALIQNLLFNFLTILPSRYLIRLRRLKADTIRIKMIHTKKNFKSVFISVFDICFHLVFLKGFFYRLCVCFAFVTIYCIRF